MEVQINLTAQFRSCLSYIKDSIKSFNNELEDFFEELEDSPVCRVGGKKYKVGDIWKDKEGKWNRCKSKGDVEYDISPCSLANMDESELEKAFDEMIAEPTEPQN